MKLFCFSFFLTLFAIISFSGCKTNQFNKQGKRVGRWEYIDTIATQVYKSSGRYRNGVERGTWKYYTGNQISRIEEYKKNISQNTFFHENGQVHSKGQAKLDVSDSLIHWYYFGDWQFFDENGKLTATKTFKKGKAVKVRKFTPEAGQ